MMTVAVEPSPVFRYGRQTNLSPLHARTADNYLLSTLSWRKCPITTLSLFTGRCVAVLLAHASGSWHGSLSCRSTTWNPLRKARDRDREVWMDARRPFMGIYRREQRGLNRASSPNLSKAQSRRVGTKTVTLFKWSGERGPLIGLAEIVVFYWPHL